MSSDTLPPAAIADTLPPPAGDELPSPRESLLAMLQPAHLAVLQLPLATIEGLLKVVEFLCVPGRGVRFDSLPSGAIDVMLAAGLGHPEDELELGYHVSQALAVDVALGEAIGGAFVKLGVVR